MVTQQQAEDLAKKHLEDYLTACGPNTVEDTGNVLMKLCSVAGVMMVAAVGHDDAVKRLQAVASFISKIMHDVQYHQDNKGKNRASN